uniref:Xanthine dehydrogenase n=1 Tax=Denticeps clupeoides TaxID=299321 RepID=A0AAY4DHC6_9TELE
MTLLTYLRRKLGLTGTKLGCAEGGCGACTVMISKFHPHLKCIVHHAVNACLAPVCSLHHCAVITVDGIGTVASRLHPVQERIAKAHGSQCGFCTPGMVMSMYTLLRNNPEPSMVDIEEAFQGNLCRCTGYRPILEGYKTFAKVLDFGLWYCMYDPSKFIPLDPTQEVIFPPELLNLGKQPPRQMKFKGERVLWIQPSTLTELLDLKSHYPESKLVVGNTEVGIEMKFKNLLYPVILAPAYISELNSVQHTKQAACTLTLLGEVLRDAVAKLPTYQTEVFKAILEQLRWFAGKQIRNVAVCLEQTIIKYCFKFGAVLMDDNFFPGYRKTALKPEEILLSIEIPYTKKGQYFSAFKQSPRQEDDIAIVTCGMNVVFKEGSNIVEKILLSFGGMAPTTVIPKTTCKKLIGRLGLAWNEKLLEDACASLAEEMVLPPSAPGGMVPYRRTLTLSLFFKFYLTVKHYLAVDLQHEKHQYAVPPGQSSEDFVGRPIMHLSALKQATGEAVYCDDIPCYENELHLALITSTKAHAHILSIDTGEAMTVPGVVAFVFAKDIPGSNITGPAFYDESVLAEKMVTCVGHIVGAVVADTQAHAQRAAKVVKITYDELKPIISIQDAIDSQSFYQPVRTMKKGDTAQGFKDSDHILEGEIHIGGQEHFYLETNCTVAVPKGEDGEMELFVSTQTASKTQALVAKALGVPANRIVCRVKRMGGGFGGKESRSIILSTVVAVAASNVHELKRPVRCMLDRDEDMLVTGGRHPFLGRYKVGYMTSGKIIALDVTFYANAGNSKDLSFSIVERALFHMENSYNIPHVCGTGYMCKTNLPSNTAFRGFGGPQGMMVAESWMSDVALACGIPSYEVRRMNLYNEGDLTPFNQRLEQFTIGKCWEECLDISNYMKRQGAVEEFNRYFHRWTKRGLSIIPTKFGISFTSVFLNQAGALVHIYTDGSVLLTHGGTEMGQGLHTKMVQVASRALGIPCSKIFISETSTNTVANTSPTAASASSDLNGMAVYNACQTLLQRLEPYKVKNPKGSWEDWVNAAYFDRVNLSANGFYNNSGRAFNYFSYGVSCSEVEIDCLTGRQKTLHTTIVMDVGKSLNPAIDIGQVCSDMWTSGAFMQGLGLFTLEELHYSPQGSLLTRGPGMYKIPAFGDIPVELQVSLLRDSPNDKAIFSSKVLGEPPLFMAASVFYAIKDAITAARSESGLSGPFRLDSPATSERIRNACEDRFTKLCPPAEPGTYTPWAVRV